MNILRTILFSALLTFGTVSAQEETGEAPPAGNAPSFAGKSIDQLSADEVLKLVRYSYTLYNRDFSGLLRTGFATKVPFLMSLKPESIRFIFDDPAQIIYLDTRDNSFALFEGVGGAEMKPVDPSKYDQQIRGTDATYDDLSMRFLYWPNAKIVKLDRIKSRDCWLVRVRNPAREGAYATVDVWIDRGSGAMVKMIGYNAQGRPIRRFEVLSGKKFGDIWMVDEMRIETISPAAGGQIKSSTRMQIKSTVE
ncbi:MAG: outer membrane lipoprotein-sorting protein [Verrucomicrobiales bacterium]|nr:outer membrane lipoprotein-sorting protein [Verrucomicrobiales bacterium]